MKILAKKIHHNQGYVILIPEEIDDFYAIYSLVEIGDSIRGSTYRKTKTENELGLKKSKKVKTTVTLKISNIEYEHNSESIRFNGINMKENKWIPLYAYQSIQLETNMKLILEKHYWDSLALQELHDLADPRKSSELAVAVLEEGRFNLAVVRDSGTHYLDGVERNIPKKRLGYDKKDSAIGKFLEEVMMALVNNLDWAVVKCIVLASVGVPLRERLYQNLLAYKKSNAALLKDPNYDMKKLVLAPCSSGFKHSVHEVLGDPNLKGAIGDTKAFREQECLTAFFRSLEVNPLKVAYGFQEVQTAGEQHNVHTLLITDDFLRGKTLHSRSLNLAMMEGVRATGGSIFVLKALHPSGERLNAMSGIAAILRAPFDYLADKEWVEATYNQFICEDETLKELAKYTGEYGATFKEASRLQNHTCMDEVQDESKTLSETIEDDHEDTL